MPGPAPTPTTLKVLRGNPGKRPLPTTEPTPRGGEPSCPAWLPVEAKKEWRRIMAGARGIGLFTLDDRTALSQYCVTYAIWREAVEVLTSEGGPGKATRRRVQDVIDLGRQMSMAMQQCGLTPASRSR